MHVLRILGLLFAFLVAGGGPLCAADRTMPASKPEMRKEIVGVIDAQLAAFRRGDAAAAHRLASAELRAQKPLRVFTAIVRENYPEIWASTRAEAGIVRDDGAHAGVTVQVYSKTSDAAYDYTLVKEKSAWRISGVVRHASKRGGTL